MRKIAVILSVFIMLSMTNCGQNNTNQKNMNNIKSQSLCVLEETDYYTTYLTNLVRIVQKAGDEQRSYAGGDELFLRYEIWVIMKKEKNRSYQERAILRCIPERIAMENGESYDTYVFFLLKEIADNYKNGKLFNGDYKPSGEWVYVGLAIDNGIHTKINSYFYENEAEIPVIQENILINSE